MRRVVSVWTRWGDYVLGVKDVWPGESLIVGSPPQQLIRFDRGEPRVYLARPNEAPDERTLGAGEALTFTRHGLTYTVACEQIDDDSSFSPPDRHRVLMAAVVLIVLGAARAFLTSPPSTVLAKASSTTAAHGPTESAEHVPDRVAVFATASEPQSQPLRLLGDLRCGEAELGAYVADSRGRYGIAGPADNPDPHLARPVQGPNAHGAQARLGLRTPLGSAGPTARFGRDTALGTDAKSARGRMWGDESNDQVGDGGLGLSGSAGGVVKRIDVAPSAKNPSSVLRVLHTGLVVKGLRKASEVGRVMAAHFDDFRLCAQAAGPERVRGVELDFDITRDGRASATTPFSTALEQCLDESLSRAAFSPDATGVSHVLYPLYFVPATAALHAERVASRQPAPQAPCDCGG